MKVIILSLAVSFATVIAAALWMAQIIRMLIAGAVLALCAAVYWLYTFSPAVAAGAIILILIVFVLFIRDDPAAESS